MIKKVRDKDYLDRLKELNLGFLLFVRSASAVTSSEKSSININRKSNTCFPMSLRWSSYVAPKPRKGGSKPQNCRFPSKITLRLKKVWVCQRQSCKEFIGLTIPAKMIGGDNPFYLKFWSKCPRRSEIADFRSTGWANKNRTIFKSVWFLYMIR